MDHRTTVRLAAGWLLSVVAAACVGGGGPDDAGFAVRDSAGVRIVEYASVPTGQALELSDAPLWRHGHREGDHPFEMVLHGALQPDGGAVVADVGSQEVLAIGPDGAVRGRVARSGQGPAEVRGVASVTVLGQDTVLIEDDGNAKLLVVARGEVVRNVSLLADRSMSMGLWVHGADASGAPLMLTGGFRTDFTEPWRQGHLVRFDLDAVRPDTVGAYDMAPRRPEAGPENPFAAWGAATVTGGGFVHGRADRAELVWRDSDGSVRQILRWRPEPRYATSADFDAFLSRSLVDLRRSNPNMSPERMKAFLEEEAERFRLDPEVPLPHFVHLVGDHRGGVWLAPFSSPPTREFAHYQVIAPDGEWLGRVDVPPRFTLLEIRGERILGVVRDDLDVQSVVAYGFTPAG